MVDQFNISTSFCILTALFFTYIFHTGPIEAAVSNWKTRTIRRIVRPRW